MTIDEIRERLKAIEAERRDDERAHADEDRLAWDFIRHVATQAEPPLSLMAEEVLKSKEIDFARWYA